MMEGWIVVSSVEVEGSTVKAIFISMNEWFCSYERQGWEIFLFE